MRIASYNIRKSVGLDWRRDPDRIVDVLSEIDADVVVLQEADKRTGSRAGTLPAERLIRECGYEFADVSTRVDSHGWHGNAILFRPPFLLSQTQRLILPSIEPRGAVAATFTHPDAGELRVIGTHLALSGGMRAKQVKALRTHIHDSPMPTVVAADFNEWKTYGRVFEGFGPDFDVVIPGRSFHSARPIAALDRFVFYSFTQSVSAGVHTSTLARRASDHLPVYVDIDLTKIERQTRADAAV